MEKVLPWCGQPSDRERLKTEQNRTELWNRLPASAVLAENIQMFKKLLKHVDFLCNVWKGLVLLFNTVTIVIYNSIGVLNC